METTTNTKEKLIHTHYWGNQQGNAINYQRAQVNPPKLPYTYSAMHALWESDQLKNHFLNFHMKSFENYLDLVNNSDAEKMDLPHLFSHQDKFDEQLIETACSIFNHQLFWDNLSPYGGEISHQLEQAINYNFGSVFKMKQLYLEMGNAQNCCGWLWLVIDNNLELQLITTRMNKNTLLSKSPIFGLPILAIDLWEHAYFQKFHDSKIEYLKTVWMMINWNEVSNRYNNCFK